MTLKTHNIVREAWQKTKGTKLPIYICGLCTLATLTVGLLSMDLFDNEIMGDAIFFVFGMVIFAYVAAVDMIGLKAARGETPSKGIAFHYFHKIIPVFSIYLIYIVAFACLGLALYYLIAFITSNTQQEATNQVLSIFGFASIFLFFAIKLFLLLISRGIVGLSVLLAIDKNLNPIQAYTASFHALKGHYVKVSFLYLELTTLIALGSLTIIGLLWIMPMLYISTGILYRELVEKKHEHAEPNPV
jgi:hypothetical protein